MNVPSILRESLDEGIASQAGGEIVVRSGDTVARIYIYKGEVAWVHCTSLKITLRQVLCEVAELGDKELGAALEECRSNGGNFGETLIARGLTDESTLHRCLLQHNRSHFRAICELPEPHRAMFVPQAREYAGGLFSLEDLFGDTRRRRWDPTSMARALRNGMASIPGGLACAAVGLAGNESLVVYAASPNSGPLDALGDSARNLLRHNYIDHAEEAYQNGQAPADGSGRQVVLHSEDHTYVFRQGDQFENLALVMVCERYHNFSIIMSQSGLLVSQIEEHYQEQ